METLATQAKQPTHNSSRRMVVLGFFISLYSLCLDQRLLSRLLIILVVNAVAGNEFDITILMSNQNKASSLTENEAHYIPPQGKRPKFSIFNPNARTGYPTGNIIDHLHYGVILLLPVRDGPLEKL